MFASGSVYSAQAAARGLVAEQPLQYLGELKFTEVSHDNDDDARAPAVDGLMMLECTSKCQEKSKCAAFIAELNLGGILQLI